ncbi:MAG: class I SAM-dependent methyltransferase [Chitinophagaceae bacterium]|nr:class I SAM-dependent methyltransferase [Chitinophagaceae bacterium]
MRKEGLSRLSSLEIKKRDRDYIVMHYLIKDLKDNIKKFAFGNVLDIGCGNKPYESLFEKKINSYTGCDVVQSDKNRVDVLCQATRLSFEDKKFDTVFSTQVMEHIDDPSAMIKETFRVLQPNGIAIFSIPFCWELHEEPYDFFRFTKYGLKSLFEREGFSVLQVKANGGKWAAIFQMNLNIIYSTFDKKRFISKCAKMLFINMRFTWIINSIAIWLDKKFYDELLTLNYVIVATKH